MKKLLIFGLIFILMFGTALAVKPEKPPSQNTVLDSLYMNITGGDFKGNVTIPSLNTNKLSVGPLSIEYIDSVLKMDILTGIKLHGNLFLEPQSTCNSRYCLTPDPQYVCVRNGIIYSTLAPCR